MISEWHKIKILRDFKKISKIKPKNGLILSWNQRFKQHTVKYQNFLKLIEIEWLRLKCMTNQKKIKLSDLDSMELDIFEEVSKLENIAIGVFTISKNRNS